MRLWAAKWSQTNQLDGHREHLCLWKPGQDRPTMFRTRRECVEYIEQHWGYIRDRKDLRCEPHCWRMPKPVRVEVREVAA